MLRGVSFPAPNTLGLHEIGKSETAVPQNPVLELSLPGYVHRDYRGTALNTQRSPQVRHSGGITIAAYRNDTASSCQSCHTPSGSCEATVIV